MGAKTTGERPKGPSIYDVRIIFGILDSPHCPHLGLLYRADGVDGPQEMEKD